MLLTLLFVVILIISVIWCNFDIGYNGELGLLTGAISVIGLGICIYFIISSHIAVSNQIAKNKMEYDSLVKRYEIINSEYEDYSKSDVIRDIKEWNKTVITARYWNDNIWTDWFWCDKVVDELKIIDFKEE